MPERTDKQDSIAMGASFSGFTFDWLRGVKGSDIPDKALPKGWMKEWGDNTLGCWRGHMDFAQIMVRENIQSALILEDDADWDILLKKQLYEFAKGSVALQYNETSKPSTLSSPYGDDWDILWLGHCSAANRYKEDGDYYVIPGDPTVPPPEKIHGSGPNRSPAPLAGNQTRIIFESDGGRCTSGYALSLRGARTLLYIQSMTVAHSIDRGLSRMCSSRELPFKCIHPWPTIIGSFKDSGDTSKDSDRVNAAGSIRKVAETFDVQYSVRLNVNAFISGGKTFKAQFPEGNKFGDISHETEIPEGHMEHIKKEQFVY